MKKTFRSILSIAIVICMLSTSLFTGTFALSDGADNLRKQIVSAINGLEVTADTTAEDIIAAVTAVDANATTTWKVDFTKVLPTNGAIITLNGVEVDGGVVRAHDGSIKGILNVESAGSNFDVAVDFTLKATYETINCTKQATINVIPSADESAGTATFATNAGYVEDADLVVIDRTSGSWNISKNFFKDNTTIKAVIAKTTIANCMDNAFRSTSALQAVVFNSRVSAIQTQAFWASKVKYIEFSEPVETTSKLNIGTNAFGYSGVNNLYISSFPALKIDTKAFVGAKSLQQLRVDGASINTIASGSLLTHETRSIATVVCNDAATASKFTGSGALATIDVSKTAIVDYYGEVSTIKVMDDVTADYVVSAAEALDTADAFTVSAEKNGNVFEVSITDANAVTVIAYVETFSSADLKASVETILDKYSYTNATTQEDINNYLQGILGNEYEIVWLENYSMTEKVDGAEVWARIDAESDYALYGTVPGQDKAIRGCLVIKNSDNCAVIDLNKVIEKAEYQKYELNGICTTDGSDGGNATKGYKTKYDGTSELVIVNGSTIYTSHLNATAIDTVFGEPVSQNIKAVIVKGNPKDSWSCFAGLTGLEVAIIENTAATSIGNSVFGSCTNLKYVYIPDNLLTTTVGTANNAHAFYKCSPFTVLVPQGFDTTSLRLNKVNNVYTYATGVTRYTADAEVNQLVSFYNEVSAILSATSVEELEAVIQSLPSYDESYAVSVVLNDSEFTVTINDLFVVKTPVTTPYGIKKNITNYLSSNNATNETTSDDVLNAVLNVPGVETVEWSTDYGFEKILATNGAQITLKGKVVEGGIVRGHYGSITGVVTVTTMFGDTFDAKVAITIDPTYEIIDCNRKATVTIESDSDTYFGTEGYDIFADLVIVNVKNSSSNVPANYFGASETLKNRRIKAVIFNDDVSTVLEKAFWHTSALQAVAFKKVSSFNNQAFWASSVKYIDFGSTGKNFNIGNANVFGYCQNLSGLYIQDRTSVTLGNQAFAGCKNLAQIYIDADTITKIGTNVFNSNSSATASVTTVVCNGTDAVSMVEEAGALAVVDATAREISVYDVNYDFIFDARDIVKLKKMVAELSDDTNYDVNHDGAVNATDLTATRQEILDGSKKK